MSRRSTDQAFKERHAPATRGTIPPFTGKGLAFHMGGRVGVMSRKKCFRE